MSPFFSDASRLVKSAATMTPDDKQVEAAFAEMAYNAVSNKVGVLMKDPHRIGFEVVHKNDDNTKMLGVHVFRLGMDSKDQIVYVPCIFVNGKVHGTDLLYRVGPKKFAPCTPEWTQFLLDMADQTKGKPQERNRTAKLYPNVHLEKMLNTPANFGKRASDTIPTIKQDVLDVLPHWVEQLKVAGVLRDYIVDTGTDTLEVLAQMFEARPKLARACLKLLPEGTLTPDELQPTLKEASADEPLVVVRVGQPSAGLFKEAADGEDRIQRMFENGYSVDAAETKAPAYFVEVFDGEDSRNLVSPGDPGVTMLCLSGGDRIKVLLANRLSRYELLGSDNMPAHCGSSPLYRVREPVTRIALAMDEEGMWSGTEPLWTEPTLDKDLSQIGTALADVQPGLYSLVSPEEEVASEPVWISSNKAEGAVRIIGVHCHPKSGSEMLVVNPDLKTSRRKNVFSDKWRALPVKHSTHKTDDPCCGGWVSNKLDDKVSPNWLVSPLSPASDDDVRSSTENPMPGTKRARLESDGKLWRLHIGKTHTSWETRRAMHCKLAGMLEIHPDTAEHMLCAAQEKKSHAYYLQFNEKQAGLLSIIDSPQFSQTYDPVQGKPSENDQGFVLRTQRQNFALPAPRIGDHYDPVRGARNSEGSGDHNIPDELLMSGAPEQIAQYAIAQNLPHVFDHAILGSMARAFHSAQFLDQYLPKLEDGLDSLARCIFLYHWRQEDWKNLYGLDDLQELESQMMSTFKVMGDLVLALLKKPKSGGAVSTQ